jgi:hypothetical protein
LDCCRRCVQKILTEQVGKETENSEIESQLIFDRDLWLAVGWDDLTRIYAGFIHLENQDGNIWIQRNMTKLDIAQRWVDRGILKEDMVLGLQPPYKRPYPGYGTGTSLVESSSYIS